MNKYFYFIIALCAINYYSFSQVGIGTTNPDPSSILDVQSTTQGFLPPRMTTAEINAIINPAEGLFVYNLDSNCFKFYNGTAWSGCLGETPKNALDLKHFLDNKSLITKKVKTSYSVEVEVPAFKLNDYVVWGATAMMLSEIKDMLKQL